MKNKESYFQEINEKIHRAYDFGNKARQEGNDLDVEVESIPAPDLARRVEGLVGPEGIATRIKTLGRENIAQIIDEILGDFRILSRKELEERVEQAVRTSLAILTEGVVAAPIEGIAKVEISENPDGSLYLSLYFSGPIRSAGGTAQGVTAVIGDYLRRKVGLKEYRPTSEEVERYVEEINTYHARASRLQYMPSDKEIREIVKNLPVCIDGDPTEEREVSIHRDLRRVKTNRIRGGMCLVIAEGIAQKASKVGKFADSLKLDWGWLAEIKEEKREKEEKGNGDQKFMSEIVGGRPIFSSSSQKGGFRVRYGRSRCSGLAGKAIHPALQILLGEFIATGTQLKVEKPGKGCIITACDSIEGAVVKLKDGSVLRVESVEKAREIKDKLEEILFLGDILISYGDFLQSNAPLIPTGYCEEFWLQEMKEKTTQFPRKLPSPQEALELAEKFDVPLHPYYTYHWEDLEVRDLEKLGNWLLKEGGIRAEQLRVKNNSPGGKRILELLGVPHQVEGEEVAIKEYLPLVVPLGIYEKGEMKRGVFLEKIEKLPPEENAFQFIQEISPVRIRKKVGGYIGARMGRPEKARERKLNPPVHSLFPVGRSGGKERLINAAVQKGTISVEAARYECQECGVKTILPTCPQCGKSTLLRKVCPQCNLVIEREICPRCKSKTRFYERQTINLGSLWKKAIEKVGPANVKGVLGLISIYKIPEPLEKGLLRAKNGVFVFKDGTIRYDATDAPLTHFKPKEIGTSIEKLKELGYLEDIIGKELTDEEQILELKVQDVVIPEEGLAYLFRVSKFVDDELEKFYNLSKFYNAQNKEDLLGELVVGLAPHTSAGITGRIIGVTKAKVCFAHPFWHSAKRRNCLSKNTSILVLNSNTPAFLPMGELYESINSKEKIVDDFGALEKKIDGLKTFSLNPETGVLEIKNIRGIIRTPAPNFMVRIRSKSGRTFTSSPQHRVMVHSEDKIKIKKVLEVDKGDKLLAPEKIEIKSQDNEEIDLLIELLESRQKDVMVRGIREVVSKLVKKLNGLNKVSEKLKLNKKTFSDYIYRDSIPLSVLESLLSLSNKNWELIPRSCKLGVKRDSIVVPRIIKVDDKFLRLLGYYLAEGYGRESKKSFYQINFAATEKGMKEDIKDCITESFGVSPNESRGTIGISSRLIYHLFTEILKLGKRAKDKRLPYRFVLLSKKKIGELLKAYFSGDGSVEEGRLHVTCSSINPKLLRDIGFQLLRFGIFYRLKTERRRVSGVVKEFYKLKGRGEDRIFKLHYLSIRSSYAKKFFNEIGFSLKRKQEALKLALPKERKPRLHKFGNFILDEIKEREIIPSKDNFLYDVEVEDHHNFLVNDFILSANCDGDEDSVMLFLDVLLNFSKKYLPEKRGGQMDAPLVISTTLDPREIDDEAHKMELTTFYPLEFYGKTLEKKNPAQVEIKTVKDVLDNDPYSDLKFTHSTSDITGAVVESSYVKLKTMTEKVDAQLKVAEKIRAVDEKEVAELVINSHFLRDTYGNMRAFSRQKFRCVKCNKIYRRVPLIGKCTKCGGKLLLTVPEGGVRKYMDLSLHLSEKYNVSNYLKQRLQLIKKELSSLFVNDLSKQVGLGDFM